MDLYGSSFGYDYFKPTNYYNLKPEDLNPALRLNHRQNPYDYYSEPSMHRVRSGSHIYKPKSACACGKKHSVPEAHTNLYMLIIILVIVTVIQWFVIFFSSGSGSVTINNITTHEKPPEDADDKK